MQGILFGVILRKDAGYLIAVPFRKRGKSGHHSAV